MSEDDDRSTRDAHPWDAQGGSIRDPWQAQIDALEDPTTVSPRRAELRRLAAAARRVMHGLVSIDASVDELAAAADHLEEVASLFDTTRRSMYEGFAEAANSGDPHAHFDHSPMLGLANPLAPPIRMRISDESTMTGTVTFDAGYEGPPGCVHGGYVAAAFDELLGAAQSLGGKPGMTGRLIVNYRSPTPLHEELTIVGRFERAEGRKIFTTGTIHAGDRLCAEAEGLFISIDFERFASLKTAREEQRAARAARRDSSD